MPSDPLQDALTALNALLRPMTDIVRWYDDPPESLSEFPCGLTYADSGDLTTQGGGWSVGRHTITINVYHSRQVLPAAINSAKVWPYRILVALAADITLGGKVVTIEAAPPLLRYRMGPLQYNSEMHYGCTANITVKVIQSLTIA